MNFNVLIKQYIFWFGFIVIDGIKPSEVRYYDNKPIETYRFTSIDKIYIGFTKNQVIEKVKRYYNKKEETNEY